MKTLVLVLPQLLDAGLGITLDVLGAANRLRHEAGRAPVFDVSVVSAGPRNLTTGNGLYLGPLPLLTSTASLPRADLVVLVSCNVPTAAEVDRWLAAAATRRAVTWLRAQAQRRGRPPMIAASCAGSFILAEAGLLDARQATTTWWLSPHFRARYPRVELDMQKMVVQDGAVITAGAAFAQADLMLALVAQHGSPSLARACARYLLLDERRSQARYAMIDHLSRQHPRLQQAERWIVAHLAEPFTVGDLADALHVTPRTLTRQFAAWTGGPPIRYVQRMRVDRAIELLETTRLPLQTVAERVGYADATTLRKLMQRERGVGVRGVRGG